jgi:hypothetical protein
VTQDAALKRTATAVGYFEEGNEDMGCELGYCQEGNDVGIWFRAGLPTTERRSGKFGWNSDLAGTKVLS